MTMHRLSHGGADRVGVLLANGFVQVGIPTRLLLLRDGGEGEDALRGLLHPDVVLVSAGPPMGSRHLELLRGWRFIRRQIASERPAVVMASSNNMGLVTGLSAKFPGKHRPRYAMKVTNPVVILPRDAGAFRRRYRRHLYGFVFDQFDRILTLTEAERRTLSGLYPRIAKRFETAPNAYIAPDMLADHAADRDRDRDRLRIVTLARLMPQKRLDVLLSAFALVRASDARLTILGEGPERPSLERLAQSLGIADRVDMPGFVEDVVPWLRAADLFVLTSEYEGLPAALIEALACNVPVVTTDCFDGATELLAAADGCAVVPKGDAQAIAVAIDASLSAPERPLDLRRIALAYGIDASIAAHVAALRPLINAPRPAPDGTVGRIYANLARLMGGKAVAGIISLIYMAIALRALGVRDYGVLILVHGYTITVGGVIEFPGWHAVVRYGAQAIEAGDRSRLVRLLRFTGLVELACGALAVAVAATLAPYLGPRLGWSPTALAFALPYSFAVLATIRSAPAGYLQLVRRFDLLGWHNLVAPSVRLAGASIAWALGAGLHGFLIAWLAAALAEWASMWLLGWVIARRQLENARLFGSPRGASGENPGIRRFMLSANADVTLGELAQRVAPLAVGWAMGPAAAGIYAVAQRATTVIAQPAGNLGQAAYAELARIIAAGAGGSAVRRVVFKSILIAIAAAIPFVILVAVFGGEFARLLGGKNLGAAGSVMVLLVAARTVLLAAPAASAALVALGRPGLSVAANTVCALVLLPFLPLLMENFGLVGAGYHALVTAMAAASLLTLLMWRASNALR